MAEVKVYGRLENHERVLRMLRGMDGELKERVVDALLKGGEIVAEEARQRVPVDTGRLRDSIKVKEKKNRQAVQHVGVTVEADYPANAGVRKTSTRKQKAGSKEYYAFAVEYGTRHMDARPFLNPALAAKAEEVYKNVDKALEALCDEANRTV